MEFKSSLKENSWLDLKEEKIRKWITENYLVRETKRKKKKIVWKSKDIMGHHETDQHMNSVSLRRR
jgi:regulator of replication initiation timing